MTSCDSWLKRAAWLGSFLGGIATAATALSAAFIALQAIEFKDVLTQISNKGIPVQYTQIYTTNLTELHDD